MVTWGMLQPHATANDVNEEREREGQYVTLLLKRIVKTQNAYVKV